MTNNDKTAQASLAKHTTPEAIANKSVITRATINLWPDAGKALGLGRNSTFKAAKSGQIPTLRIGKRLLVSRSAFERLLDPAAAQQGAAEVSA